jgi:hypothetical protein
MATQWSKTTPSGLLDRLVQTGRTKIDRCTRVRTGDMRVQGGH